MQLLFKLRLRPSDLFVSDRRRHLDLGYGQKLIPMINYDPLVLQFGLAMPPFDVSGLLLLDLLRLAGLLLLIWNLQVLGLGLQGPVKLAIDGLYLLLQLLRSEQIVI